MMESWLEYQANPEFQRKTILSSKIVILDPDRNVLLIRRSTSSQHNAGLYELPGGKIGPYENIAFGLSREIDEETGLLINLEPVNFQTILTYNILDQSQYNGYIFHLVAGVVNYPCLLSNSNIQLSDEHDAWKAVPLDQLSSNHNLITANSRKILKTLLDYPNKNI